MRSGIALEWLHAEGIDIQRIEGGYKRMRNHLLSVLQQLPPLLIVSGKTGAGKTQVINALDQSIDLEGIAPSPWQRLWRSPFTAADPDQL